jgi:hypothetical protein
LKDTATILVENRKRNKALDAPYDPVTGRGSLIPRTEVTIGDFGINILLPQTMLKVEWVKRVISLGSFTEYAKEINANPLDVFLAWTQERYIHDFEYWAFQNIQIFHKLKLVHVPFCLNLPQRTTLEAYEKQRRANRPIRVIIDKARQWGGSTLTEIYMMWIQQIHKRNWHMAVCAQDDSAAKNINAMYTRAAELYPKETGSISLGPYERSPKNRICKERGSIIGVGSYLAPDQFRSYNYPMIHFSEVGLYQDTMKRKAANVAQSLRSAVPYVPYSVIVLESTAKGVGNFFHNEWLSAIEGKSHYAPVFVPWWQIEMYRSEILDYDLFIQNMTEYDWFLWGIGATLEGINWYKLTKAGENYTDWQMKEEFPSTWEESFQSSGHRYFDPAYVQALSQDVCPPEFIGDIFAKARIGENALIDIRFSNVEKGPLWAWSMPDRTQLVKNRYCFFADIGGKTHKADWSVLSGMDRIWMIEDGDPEAILTYRTHMDQDLFAWKCVQICMAYAVPEIGEYPLLAIEFNSLKKEQGEGDHFYTVLNRLSEVYPNLYIRNDFEKVGDEFIPKYGFMTNQKTKTMILDAQNAAARGRFMSDFGEKEGYAYIEHDQRAINEMTWYEIKANGSLGAIDGKNDDIEITRAGCVWLSNEHMDKPFYVEDQKTGIYKPRVMRESNF